MCGYTRSGDDGLTNLLGAGQIPKHDIRIETMGSIDEANAILGVARSICASTEVKDILYRIQQDLSIVMGEIASSKSEIKQDKMIDSSRIDWLEMKIEEFSRQVNPPEGFIIPGDSFSGAMLDLARTAVRRAERQLVRLKDSGYLGNEFLLKYINRLSSLCFVLELSEDQTTVQNHSTE